MTAIDRIIEQNRHLQEIVSAALRFSLEPLTLEEHLQNFLDLMLTIPDLAFHAKGSIFLVDPLHNTLVLAAHQDLPEELVKKCARVPFGSCLCGRAAERSEILFTGCVDYRHEIRFRGMADHGHYCVPVLSGDQVLGVINLYVPEGHVCEEHEERALMALANILAGIIERRRGEDALLKVQRELIQVVGSQTEKVVFNDPLLKQIIQFWQSSDGRREGKPPRVEQIRAILDAVYYASMHRKEDHPIQVSVTLMTDLAEMNTKREQQGIHPLILENPLPLQVDSLVALAPSFDPMETTLVVVPVADPLSQLDIVGVLHFPEQGLHRFDAHTFARPAIGSLTVAAKEAGNLHLFRGATSIGQFSSGVFTHAQPISFTESPLAWSLVKEIQTHPEFESLQMLYWRVYRDWIDRLLLEISAGGHGGAVIWLPTATQKQAMPWMDSRFPLREAPEGSAILSQFARLEQWIKRHPKTHDRHVHIDSFRTVKSELINLVELFARLTHMDGALVLSDRLKPLTFGAMLHANAWQGQIVSWEEEPFFPSIHLDFKKMGARHASAVNFVGQCPGAVAFVVSQDGPVAGLTRKDEETIYWWPDCLGRLWRTD
ncbi:MAG: GAF domain-containing protein [Magnetococcales bacterium]|nr:GAF domain-containing protein [Magnetococcales bacterium]